MVLASSPREPSGGGDDSSGKRSLAAVLRDRGPLSPTDAVDVALDVCDALANAHANGVVHGDLGIHRVRTAWPRAPGQTVDIFALDDDDSAARSMRASSAGAIVAPEQREGRVVDVRADVWAVGALLHWTISGAPPGVAPIAHVLRRAPRPLVAAIEACLELDPERRPRSVDEVTERIASFSSAPAHRFEQLARRRVALASPSGVRAGRGDVDRALARLDDAALDRELSAVSARPTADRISFERLVPRRADAASAIFPKGTTPTSSSAMRARGAGLADADLLDDDDDVETTLWTSHEPRSRDGAAVVEPVRSEQQAPQAQPTSIPPVAFPSAPPPPSAIATPAFAARGRPAWTVLAVVGSAAAVALVMTFGPRLVERAPWRASAASRSAAAASMPPPRATDVPALAPDTNDSPLVTPEALPDVVVATPAALPDAPASVRPSANGGRSAGASGRSPAPSASASSGFSLSRSLEDALR